MRWGRKCCSKWGAASTSFCHFVRCRIFAQSPPGRRPIDKHPVSILQPTKMFQSPYYTIVTVIHTVSTQSYVWCIGTHVHNIQTLLDQKNRRRRRRRRAVNAANKGELAACHFGHACHTSVSPGVEARLQVGLPSHVSTPRFGQFYTPKRSGRLWRPPNPYSKAPGVFSPVGKWEDHEVNHTPSSSVKVWNV
jgi:hypothetical protein